MERIRCFIAVDFPREIIKEVERVQKELEKKKLFHGKLTEGENLHLTLKFLGEIDSRRINNIIEKLKEIDFPSFKSYLGDLGVFSSDFIRIVWVKILGKDILELQEEIDNSLDFKKEERFMSHLTIARVKNVKDKKIFLQELKKIKVQNFGFDIDSFYLMRSDLEPEGPVYTILEKFNLKGISN